MREYEPCVWYMEIAMSNIYTRQAN